MKVRERIYDDYELAKRIKGFLDEKFGFMKDKIDQKGSAVFIRYRNIEYALQIHSNNGDRFIILHIERPPESLKNCLTGKLEEDSIFQDKENFGFLKRGNLGKYRKMFKRAGVREGSSREYVQESERDTIAVVTRIKDLPVGTRGHLSGNFANFLYEYVVRPVFAQTESYHQGGD